VTAEHRYRLILSPTARRQLAEVLPRAVAFAAHEFIVGPLLDHPQRVGKPLAAPLADRHSARRGTYRVVYRIDEGQHTVTVVAIAPRADAYRP
jgi:mRNA-degrading endonuclease RelE of RelBE toxin-antitoxin system